MRSETSPWDERATEEQLTRLETESRRTVIRTRPKVSSGIAPFASRWARNKQKPSYHFNREMSLKRS